MGWELPELPAKLRLGRLGILPRIPSDTVDGRNPAPVDRWFIPLFIGFQPSFWWCRISPISITARLVRHSIFLSKIFNAPTLRAFSLPRATWIGTSWWCRKPVSTLAPVSPVPLRPIGSAAQPRRETPRFGFVRK